MTCRLVQGPRVNIHLGFRTPSSRRPFFPGLTNPSTQILTASKIIPYPASRVFDLVADVDSYSQFVPYCQQSRVTHWTLPTTQEGLPRLPLQADLHVGWGAFEEVFTSRLTCNPEIGLVEARSGRDVKPLPVPGDSQPTFPSTGVFNYLTTRWSIKPCLAAAKLNGEKEPAQWSKVNLHIEFQFANPLYAAVSGTVSETMASVMTEAFEKYARRKLGPACHIGGR